MPSRLDVVGCHKDSLDISWYLAQIPQRTPSVDLFHQLVTVETTLACNRLECSVDFHERLVIQYASLEDNRV